MLLLIVVFMFFALAVDTGIWALDHRYGAEPGGRGGARGALELAGRGAVGSAPRRRPSTPRSTRWRGTAIDDPDSYGCDDLAATPLGYGRTPRLRAAGTSQIARVEVCQRRRSEVVFSALTGVLDVMVSAKGVAAAMYEEPLIYSLMAMSQDGCGPGVATVAQRSRKAR